MTGSMVASEDAPLPRKFAEFNEVLRAVEPQIRVLIQNHRETSTRWMPHEVVPWGLGEDYIGKPWHPDQCKLSPEIVIALETNLLTEDNLPFYYSSIARGIDPASPLGEWSRLWTSEEGAHGSAIRDYMLLTRVMDPVTLEQNRLKVMQVGFYRHFENSFELFAYTTAQELATRISHLETGKQADEPVLYKLLNLISRDENFHYIFYRSLVKEFLEIVPELMLPAIAAQFYGFGMPGGVLDDFASRSAVFEKEGIFGAIHYRDHVVKPILKHWKIDQMRGLPPHIEKVQERILKLEKVLSRAIDRSQSARSV
jgi:acyl-[acyl-carrier-protein] desaturase